MKRAVKIVAFDMDGVLVPIKNSWDIVHERFGVLREAKALAENFFQGKLSYYEWLYLSTLLWIKSRRGGVSRRELEEAFESIKVSPGFKNLVERLKREGRRVIIISGGVSVLLERVASELGISEWYSSILVFDGNGKLVPGGIPVVEAGGKDRVLLSVMSRYSVKHEECAYVGDSLWDKEAFAVVGLSILYGGEEEELVACVRARTPEEIHRAILDYEKGLIECRVED
uniref:phosphoserine phosphatase n=1 Tax=Fervidicoccus fontis TaxID=683846 RepID=A0A7J3ZL73_9CREN